MKYFLFNRGLRIKDNTSLIKLAQCDDNPVICIFVFTPEQIDEEENSYFSHNAVGFMCETLSELNDELKEHHSQLYCFKGDLIKVLKKIHKIEPITVLGFNHDYTPYAIKREKELHDFCKEINATIIAEEDYLLYPIIGGGTLKADGSPYRIFTPYRNSVMKKPVPKVDGFKKFDFAKNSKLKEISLGNLSGFYADNPTRLVKGGRTEALKKLNNLKNFDDYNKTRDILHIRTTLLSAFISFGVLSIREVYWKIVDLHGKNHGLITELIWRDFYTMILYFFPYVIKGNFKQNFDKMEWENSKKWLKLWEEGQTGFPLVDAGMRQLVKEGFMANRNRMVVSSFLIKQMLINWKYGEKFFAKHLTDIYLPSNNGGWQWAFGGVDPNYWRVFNPLTQGQKFDKDCEYIKFYIPELKDVPPEHIHQWDKYHTEYKDIDYPSPCLDLKGRRLHFLKVVKKIK